MSGKGDTPRPRSVNDETFGTNWDRIFKGNDSDSAQDGVLPAGRDQAGGEPLDG